MLKITALMNDTPGAFGDIATEHGLSLLVSYGENKLLFDCGSSGLYLGNARQLGVSLDKLDAVILSHGHDDHAGGFPGLVRAGYRGNVYTGCGFFAEKYSQKADGSQCKAPGFDRSLISSHREVEEKAEILPGVWVIGNFPRCYAWETIPQRFLRKGPGGLEPDDFRDEICLAVDMGQTLAMIVGCSHPGICNMVRHVRSCLQKPVSVLFGGAHLLDADASRIEKTFSELSAMGVTSLGLCHCTGEHVIEQIRNTATFQIIPLAAGDSIVV
jgi:7,8-dihydropterin-6-yl-methyl-4-(beta-D-ribofuranosyl)aminobenzene 5'-phosphate synthase